jgi:hypothetical protein
VLLTADYRLPGEFEFFIQYSWVKQIKKNYLYTTKPKHPYPLKVEHFQSGYFSKVGLVSYVPSKAYYDRNHHESHNYQGLNYYIHNPYELVSHLSAKHQTIANYSIVVNVNPQMTIIDEALKAYEPKR